MTKLTTPQKKHVKDALFRLSTSGVGSYYDRPGEFFSGVSNALLEVGLELESDPPILHTSDGRDMLRVIEYDSQPGSNPSFYVVLSWHKMQSGRWELLAYPTL